MISSNNIRIKHDFVCEFGCLVHITHQSEVSEHYRIHLMQIHRFFKYRSNDTVESKVEVFDNVLYHIQKNATKNQ